MPVPADTKPAPHLRGLPKDSRGYLVPAEAPWTDAGPVVSKVEPYLRVVLAAYRACAVCGYPLRRDEPVWRIYDHASRRTTHEQIARDAVTDNDVPGHLVCMLYSALVCPFWRTPGGRLGQDSMFVPGAPRGEEPAILGFHDYGLLIDPTQPLGGEHNGVHVALEDYDSEIVFRDPLADLAEEYERQRQKIGGRYISTRRRHYAPDFGGKDRMAREATAAIDTMRERGPDEWVYFEGKRRALVYAGWMT